MSSAKAKIQRALCVKSVLVFRALASSILQPSRFLVISDVGIFTWNIHQPRPIPSISADCIIEGNGGLMRAAGPGWQGEIRSKSCRKWLICLVFGRAVVFAAPVRFVTLVFRCRHVVDASPPLRSQEQLRPVERCFACLRYPEKSVCHCCAWTAQYRRGLVASFFFLSRLRLPKFAIPPCGALPPLSRPPQVVVLDTIPLSADCANNPKIIQLSVAHLLAQAVYNIHHKKSISALFK